MEWERILHAFRKHRFEAFFFETAEQAAAFLQGELKGETIGIGGSVTCREMGLYELLEKENTVLWHWKHPEDLREYPRFTTYLTSANALSETGELVNIDGTGNRLSATLFGPKQVFFICGKNKLAPTLEQAIVRAREVAGPANAKRLGVQTPCAVTGRCSDCDSPQRICSAMTVYLRATNSMRNVLILIGEDLGF